MNRSIVQSDGGITIIGAGPVDPDQFEAARRIAPILVAADGGANTAQKLGVRADAVIGDLDSLRADTRAVLDAKTIHHVADQSDTDFEKCLARIDAAFVIALGVSFGRLDHGLATVNALYKFRKTPIFVLDKNDVCFLAPQRLDLRLPVGARLSLVPLAPVRGHSHGLKWPIDDVMFSPLGRIGTSNEVDQPKVLLTFDKQRMLVILAARFLDNAIAHLKET